MPSKEPLPLKSDNSGQSCGSSSLDLLDSLYPEEWAAQLIRVAGPSSGCNSAGKRPLDRNWQTLPMNRRTEGTTRVSLLEDAAIHLMRQEGSNHPGNLGLVIPEGVLALDFDTAEDAAKATAAFPQAPRQVTSKGIHLLFRVPETERFSNSVAIRLRNGLTCDLRGKGSQIVCEPSTHATGVSYRWENRLPSRIDELPLLPQELYPSMAADTTRSMAQQIPQDMVESEAKGKIPVDALPADIAHYCREVSASVAADLSMAVVSVLVGTSAMLGSHFTLRLKDNWEVDSSLWVCGVGAPGVGKTPLAKEVFGVVHRHDDQLGILHKRELAEWKARNASRPKSKEPIFEEERPKRLQCYYGDSTIEALADALAINPRLLAYYDELGQLVGSFGRYSTGPSADQAILCSIISGTRLTINRRNRPDALVIPRPCMSSLAYAQPKIIEDFFLQDDGSGFTDRICFVSAKKQPRRFNSPALSRQAKESWEATIKRIVAFTSPRCLSLSENAKAAFVMVYDNPRAVPQSLEGFENKYPKLVGTLALVLALMFDQNAVEVTVRDMEGAIEIAEWLRSETISLRSSVLAGENLLSASAAALIRRLRNRKESSIRCSEVPRLRISEIPTSIEAQVCLDELARAGLLIRTESQNMSGRNITTYAVTHSPPKERKVRELRGE